MILFFLPNLQGGGAERVLTTVLLELHKTNPEQNYCLLLERKEGEFLEDIPSSIPLYSLNTSRALSSVLPFIKFCKKYHPKIVLACLGASLAASLAQPFLPKHTILMNRIGNTIGAEKNLYQNHIKRYLFIKANKTISKKSDHIIFQCNYMAKDYMHETGIKPSEYSIIYNPVDIEKIGEKSKASLQKSYDFIAVGRLNPQKDYFTMILGFAQVLKAHPTLQLGIIGKGNLKEELEKIIKELKLQENIHLLGYISNPYPYIKQARFLISSSLYEGFSNVIIEALCLGTPVLATNCPGGNKETIKEDRNGNFFKVGDSKSLATVVNLSLKNETSFNRIIIAEEAEKTYNKKKIVAQYKTIFMENLPNTEIFKKDFN